MKEVIVNGSKYNLEEKDAALIEVIQGLIQQIKRLAESGR